ncbi:hypothetical protein FNV43_RR25115 [Rhamnella rubrinervis]|uniref:Uncharacterized protein n=1 Tax=Rhamnella rubrinervis TaxID=2594499 RepID=A0A8K0DMS3_9ROSA|nr:hypothetical protein FNV43_RR25115 [Rhamnella rubrinervis]
MEGKKVCLLVLVVVAMAFVNVLVVDCRRELTDQLRSDTRKVFRSLQGYECDSPCVYSDECSSECPVCDLSANGGGGGFYGFCVS